MKNFLRRHPYLSGWIWFVSFMSFTAATGTSCATLKNVGSAVIDCGKATVAAEVSRIAPLVDTALSGAEPDWKAELGFLEGQGTALVACALAKVVAGAHTPVLTFADISPDPRVSRAADYLGERHWKVINVR